MERLKPCEPFTSLVIEVTPNALRELANKIDARVKKVGAGASVIMSISNSVSIIYNVPITEDMVLCSSQGPTVENQISQ